MKRLTTIIILLAALHITGCAMSRGVPFFRNFTASNYNAQNSNFDVACDAYGTVFVANFEGLLYYDGATWRKILTPGISRVTRLAKGHDGKIWIGGYNIFGYLFADKHGCLQMKLLMSDLKDKGNMEVSLINASGNDVFMQTTKGLTYRVKNGKSLELTKYGGDRMFNMASDSITSIRLPNMVRVEYSNDYGLKFTMPDHSCTNLSETNGLLTNSINFVTYDRLHTLWAATEKGVFCTEVATPYSRITDADGLKGEVYAVNEIGNTVYFGTQNGLFKLQDGHMSNVKEISQACWDLVDDGDNHLIAPTSQGLYVISNSGIRQLTSTHSLSAYIDKSTGNYIVGETDGVYLISSAGKRVKLSNVEKILSITASGSYLTLQSIYGAQWQIRSTAHSFVTAKCIRKKADPHQPKLYYKDFLGRTWQTYADGTNLQVNSNATNLARWLIPLKDNIINTVHVCHDGNIIAGGDFGVIIIDNKEMMSSTLGKAERPYIRQVIAMGNNVIWGGYSPGTLEPVFNIDNIELPSQCHNVTVTFSTRTTSLVSPTLYRYRINGGEWSQWSETPYVTYTNPYWDDTKIEIQAKDIFNRESEISTVEWTIDNPWFLKWWAVSFYIVVTLYIITSFFRWRERRLEREKQKLEGIVEERTSELSAAYDKQQKISSELSDTLDDLKRTQEDLVRMEKTATAGKLTQGLIDRILNPINYINNFSKLTTGLAKDLIQDIEDEKDNMSEDNYEDCEDILDMMNQNLGKIEQHGVNTTRTLRAMEAMLNNHVGKLVSQDICPLCHQAANVLKDHYKKDIEHCSITVKTDLPDHPVMADIDAESFNRVLLSLMSNSIYYITKKYGQMPYDNAEVILSVKETDGHVVISVHDNGLGIEDAIKSKVFDPFFTTKPTGDASGVGLYLAHEIINDHHGTITLDSVKEEYCEFTITI